MNKYKLQIINIEKYAREYWEDDNKNPNKDTQRYIKYMKKDTSKLYSHICEPLIIANHWGFNCTIPKENLTIQEFDDKNTLLKTYTYQEVWNLLPKTKVNYKDDMKNLNRRNVDTFLEPLTNTETGKVVCMTNYGNHIFMIHTDLFEEFFNGKSIQKSMECPIYILEKVNNQPSGVLHRPLGEN